MAEEYKGLTLNELVTQTLNLIPSVNDKDIFMSKLQDAHYAYNQKYDEYVYELHSEDEYRVTAQFPRITRDSISPAIAKASFDLTITEITSYKK